MVVIAIIRHSSRSEWDRELLPALSQGDTKEFAGIHCLNNNETLAMRLATNVRHDN